jgi:hypothetical protein
MKRCLSLSALVLPMAITSAYAEPNEAGPTVATSGYGTLAYTMTDSNQAEFGRSNQTNGARKSPVSWVDSNLGVQGTMTVNDWLSFTGQGLARRQVDDSWGAELYWAYAKARAGRQWSIYAGRVAAPIYMISDSRNVGFANTMIRPPQEMYSLVPFDTLDGGAVTYQTELGEVNLTSQLALGATKQKFVGQSVVPGTSQMLRVSRLKALSIVAERGPLSIRVGYAQGNTTLKNSLNDTLTAALREAGAGYGLPQLNQLADAIAIDRKKASFTSLGLVFDQDNVIVQSELGQRKAHSMTSNATAWYVMGGYRIGKFLPYVSHASSKFSYSVTNTAPQACPPGYPAACTPTVQALASAVNGGLAGNVRDQSTTSLGLRWNFSQSAAFKTQLDRIQPRRGGGLLVNVAPGFSGDVTVFSAGVDFIF